MLCCDAHEFAILANDKTQWLWTIIDFILSQIQHAYTYLGFDFLRQQFPISTLGYESVTGTPIISVTANRSGLRDHSRTNECSIKNEYHNRPASPFFFSIFWMFVNCPSFIHVYTSVHEQTRDINRYFQLRYIRYNAKHSIVTIVLETSLLLHFIDDCEFQMSKNCTSTHSKEYFTWNKTFDMFRQIYRPTLYVPSLFLTCIIQLCLWRRVYAVKWRLHTPVSDEFCDQNKQNVARHPLRHPHPLVRTYAVCLCLFGKLLLAPYTSLMGQIWYFHFGKFINIIKFWWMFSFSMASHRLVLN